ncbi:unnamed protein product [Schistosoma mattheei]|uniref:Uncharacterized protein n=1 Tax=Schistosoma mattheei TaxID=31246 RepID=A0A183PCW2_9TREM|nr:unnamed protein product [Schistosoma mattheei]
MNDTHAQFLAVVKALPYEFNRYVTPSMFTSDNSELCETLERSIVKREDLTDRQRTFDDGLFKQHFLSKLAQQVQAVLVSLQNNAVDKLAASVDRILEITKSSDAEISSVKERRRTTQDDITELSHTCTLS